MTQVAAKPFIGEKRPVAAPAVTNDLPRASEVVSPGKAADELRVQHQHGYLAHIDGLRAIAVLLVIGYHFSKTPAAGFVGVDIFFVISGFLISGILLTEAERNPRRVLSDFYARRIKRILPALLVMILTVLAAEFLFFPPWHFKTTGATAIGAILSFSNIQLWLLATDYFSQSSISQPLLHTWSLGVEEQFYLLWPLILIFAVRRRILYRTAVVLALISLIGATYAGYRYPNAAFYLSPFRAFELLMGLFCIPVRTLHERMNAHRFSKMAGEILFAVGIVLIAAGAVFLGQSSKSPYPYALLPCLGTALVIVFGDKSRISRIVLMNRPSRYVGKISYSLYLWHWPIFVGFAYWFDQTTARPLAAIVLLGLSLAVAAVSYHVVEQPIRHLKPRQVPAYLKAAAFASAILVAFGGLSDHFDGFAERFSPEIQALAGARASYESWSSGTCFQAGQGDFQKYLSAGCLTISGSKPNILLIGDSHAAHLYPGLRQAFPMANILQATMASCKAIMGYAAATQPMCKTMNAYVFGELISDPRLDLVILSSAWSRQAIPGLMATLARQASIRSKLVVFGPSQEYKIDLRDLIFHGSSGADISERAQRVMKQEAFEVDARLADEVDKLGVSYFSTLNVFCADEKPCRTRTMDGAPVLVDTNHYSDRASTEVATAFKDKFIKNLRQVVQESTASLP